MSLMKPTPTPTPTPTTDVEASPKARTAADWARAVHEDGFVALDTPEMVASAAEVEVARALVLRRYERFLARAEALRVDLSLTENAERLAGFYVREGGRVDMQLLARAVQTRAADADAALSPEAAAPLLALARRWQPVLAALFAPEEKEEGEEEGGGGARAFALEYVGCVLSRPGDGDQNWHLDGVHRDPARHEPADRVNVFVPLVAIDALAGGTEMKRRSHVRRAGAAGARFESYAALESVTHRVAAGTPVVMDYRVWHRGLANASADTPRPLLYFKYARRRDAVAAAAAGPRLAADRRADGRKRRRIAPVRVEL